MINTREKLIEIIGNFCGGLSVNDITPPYGYENLADHLLANGVTVQKWIPVTERFPEKCVDYLCLCVLTDDNHVKPFCMVLRYIRDNEPHFQYELNGNIKVTHWMPLPELPKEVNDHA